MAFPAKWDRPLDVVVGRADSATSVTCIFVREDVNIPSLSYFFEIINNRAEILGVSMAEKYRLSWGRPEYVKCRNHLSTSRLEP